MFLGAWGKNNLVQIDFLVQRISRAIRNEETFRVIIVLPIWPAFEGNVITSVSMRNVLYFQVTWPSHWHIEKKRGGKERKNAKQTMKPMTFA